jgi:hypothetical protein
MTTTQPFDFTPLLDFRPRATALLERIERGDASAITEGSPTIAQPTVTADLRRELAAWRTAVGAQMMEPNPDYDPAVQRREKGANKKKGSKNED